MWIPSSSENLERLVSNGGLEEGSSLDFKREVTSNSKELAKDVAAMANDGGTLIYGVGEDPDGRPTILCPFRLLGVAERVDSIIRSTISEPPEVDIRTLPIAREPGLGYLVVVVPASPRAPHMVTAKGDNRFYGRTATSNTPLNQGDVARLYERRQRWEHDREAHLERVVSELMLPPNDEFGNAFLYSRPASPLPGRLNTLGDRNTQIATLHELIREVADSDLYNKNSSPLFCAGHFTTISAGWRNRMGGGRQETPRDILDLDVHFDCELRMVLGQAAARMGHKLVLFESGLTGTMMRFLALTGRLLNKVHYYGPVDLGIAVTGIRGASASQSLYGATPFDQPAYKETSRELSHRLEIDTRDVAADLLKRLFHATGAVGPFDPFNRSDLNT